MNRRSSRRRKGESFSTTRACTSRPFSTNDASRVWSMMGRSSESFLTMRAKSSPACASISPPRGNWTSEMTPMTTLRYRRYACSASSYEVQRRIFGRARMRMSLWVGFTPSTITCWACFMSSA